MEQQTARPVTAEQHAEALTEAADKLFRTLRHLRIASKLAIHIGETDLDGVSVDDLLAMGELMAEAAELMENIASGELPEAARALTAAPAKQQKAAQTIQ